MVLTWLLILNQIEGTQIIGGRAKESSFAAVDEMLFWRKNGAKWALVKVFNFPALGLNSQIFNTFDIVIQPFDSNISPC